MMIQSRTDLIWYGNAEGSFCGRKCSFLYSYTTSSSLSCEVTFTKHQLIDHCSECSTLEQGPVFGL